MLTEVMLFSNLILQIRRVRFWHLLCHIMLQCPLRTQVHISSCVRGKDMFKRMRIGCGLSLAVLQCKTVQMDRDGELSVEEKEVPSGSCQAEAGLTCGKGHLSFCGCTVLPWSIPHGASLVAIAAFFLLNKTWIWFSWQSTQCWDITRA